MNDETENQKEFVALRDALKKLCNNQSPDVESGGEISEAGRKRPDEVRLIYSQKQDWARHYNGLIWSITALLLPFSLGGLALNFVSDSGNLQLAKLLTLAAGSCALIRFWHLISEGQRKLWEREFKIMHIIENAWDVRPIPDSYKEAGRPMLAFYSVGIKIQEARKFIYYGGIIAWLVRITLECSPFVVHHFSPKNELITRAASTTHNQVDSTENTAVNSRNVSSEQESDSGVVIHSQFKSISK